MNTTTPLYPLARTGLRDHGDLEAFRQRQRERMRRAGWPKDRYQLLCANCNFGKAMNGGVCPHQSQEARRA